MKRSIQVNRTALITTVAFSVAASLAFSTPLLARVPKNPRHTNPSTSSTLEPGQRQITILATNDIHGGVEPNEAIGGMAFWAGAVSAIKEGLAKQHGNQVGTLVLDAGDQFQGTLISNYNEGQLMFNLMNKVGYDAAVPGNHDYDFGPIGWLEDKITDKTPADERDPRGALERVVKLANFPLLSANVYLKSSVSGTNWEKAQRLNLFKPYIIKNVAGVRVAIIGLDNVQTPTTTTVENVSDLIFRSEKDTYLEIYNEIKNQADIFVLIAHDGNTSSEFSASKLVEEITKAAPHSLDLLIAGHTHFINHALVNGVPVIQSASGGEKFGRIDFVWDTQSKSLVTEKTKTYAGLSLNHHGCSPENTFCQSEGNSVSYEGEPVVENAEVQAIIQKERAVIAPLADRKLGIAKTEIKRDRSNESPLADALTDAFRQATNADIAFLNTGGIRANLGAGNITYEDLFKVLPFNNHGVLLDVPFSELKDLLLRSIKSCGSYGPLMQSGLKVQFDRDCETNKGRVDSNAKMLRVETLAGEVLFDSSSQKEAPQDRIFHVVTFDFLAEGGSGFEDFKKTSVSKDFGILRELLTTDYLTHPAEFSSDLDGRWKQTP